MQGPPEANGARNRRCVLLEQNGARFPENLLPAVGPFQQLCRAVSRNTRLIIDRRLGGEETVVR